MSIRIKKARTLLEALRCPQGDEDKKATTSRFVH